MAENNSATVIEIVGVIVNMAMVFLTMLAILQTRAIQRKSEEPVISFSFFAIGNYYRLECENTGKNWNKRFKDNSVGSRRNNK